MWPLKKKEVEDDCKTFDLSNMKNGITCPYILGEESGFGQHRVPRPCVLLGNREKPPRLVLVFGALPVCDPLRVSGRFDSSVVGEDLARGVCEPEAQGPEVVPRFLLTPACRASIGLLAQSGYTLRDKNLKKLHRAASVGDLEKVEYLQLKEHDVNTRDRDLRTPLHLACANGYSNTVSLLTEKQCKVNVWDGENRSPLTKAVPCDRESCATILLEYSADPNLVDLDGNTALHYAACCQSVSLAAKLLKHKANLEAQNKNSAYDCSQ
ncbi:ankyrin repeat domain-containing protein 7 [Dama dama]|uniref:ankyrin repeat domain-containing protein 7 n=1 Tax=Dama dama TaxID=30532 RepID=UPI002A366EF5|nr:ankyrin repeat domain-containing protein 7 [Dama dama]